MRKDIDFNFVPHPMSGDLATKTEKSAIVQSIKNLIETSFYERGFNMGFGTNVRATLFELFSPLDFLTIADFIKEAVRNFERDVYVVDVDIYNTDSDDNSLTVIIRYTELNNPNEQEVVISLQRLR